LRGQEFKYLFTGKSMPVFTQMETVPEQVHALFLSIVKRLEQIQARNIVSIA